MQRKVYGLPGKKAAIINIPFGKGALEVEFAKGCLDRKNYKPATYATNDEIIQNVIENSPMFKSGVITIAKIYELEEKKPVVTKVATPKKVTSPEAISLDLDETPEIEVHEEVTKMADAIVVLKAKGAKVADMQNLTAIKETASKLGVSFPNLK